MSNKKSIRFRVTQALLTALSKQSKPFNAKKHQILTSVLVNGENQSSVAAQFNVTQQYVSKSVADVYKRLSLQMETVPDILAITTVAIHPDLLPKLLELQTQSYKLVIKNDPIE